MAKGSYINKTPILITHCAAWLDGADTRIENIISSGGLVSAINNKADPRNPFIQATSGNQPLTGVSTMAGKNVLTFDGTNDYLSCNALASVFTGNDTPVSVFAVHKPTNTSPIGPTIWSAGNSANSVGLFMHDNSTNFNASRIVKRDNASAAVFASTAVIPANTPTIMSMSCAGTTLKAWKNGTLFYNGAFNVGTVTFDRFTIGARPNPPDYFYVGDIAEIIIYNRALSDSEVASIEDYLGNKWGIAIS